MGEQMKARVAGAGEHALELRGRMAELGGIEPDADDLVAVRERRIERALRRRLRRDGAEST